MKTFVLILGLAVLSCVLLLSACDSSSGTGPAPVKGMLEVSCSPANAEISISGESRGVVGAEAKQFELLPGVYLVKASCAGYRTERRLAAVKKGGKTVLELKLRESTGVVLFTSSPSGAKVVLDGVEVGTTPFVAADVRNGKHSATFRLSRHSTDMRTWEMTDSACEIVDASLSSNTGNLIVSSDPSGARITINGKSYGTTPFNEPFDAGEYTIRIETDNNEPYEKKVTVLRGEDTSVDARLALLPGGVEISSDPAGARVVLYDSANNMVRGSEAPLKVDKLSPGDYKAAVTLEGFDTETVDLKVAAGMVVRETVHLSSNMGGIDLVTQPAGVSIYVNGRFRGVTEAGTDDAETSKTFSLRNLSAGKYRVDYVHRRALPSKKQSFNYIVKKGETLRVQPVSMWVSNARIVLKNGRQYEGRIVDTAADAETVNFQPEPGVGTTYKRSEIASIVPLSMADTVTSKARGVIELKINQPGVVVSVNGRRHGSVKALEKSPLESEKYVIGELSPGTYKIDFYHRDAKPEMRISREYTVSNDEVLKPDPVFIWVPNVSITFKSGKQYNARLVEKTDSTLVFEPEPGMKVTVKLSEVEKMEIIPR